MTVVYSTTAERRVRELERFVRHIVESCDTIEALAQHSGENWREVFQLYAKELRAYAERHLPAGEAAGPNSAATSNGAGAAEHA